MRLHFETEVREELLHLALTMSISKSKTEGKSKVQ